MKVKDFTTSAQKNAYSMFHRLVYNIKRIFEKVPFGSSRIKSYAAALFLIREETGMSEEDIMDVLDRLGIDTSSTLCEESEEIQIGDYILNEDVYGAKKGSVISVEDTNHTATFAGINIYKSTNGTYFTADNVK